MKKRFLFIFLFVQCTIFAQNVDLEQGFYISEKGDTVKGFFDLSNVYKNYVNFSATNTSNNRFTKLYPYDIQQIVGKKSVCVLSKAIENNGEKEFIFLDQLTFSEIHLYKGVSENIGDVFFINTIDRPEIVKIPKLAFEPFFTTYFYGCSGFGTLSYSETGLKKGIAFFQKCQYKTELKTNDSKRKMQFAVGFNTLFEYGRPRAANGDYYNAAPKVIPGFLFRLKMSRKMSLQSGLSLSIVAFSTKRGKPGSGFTYIKENYTFCHFPLILNYVHKPEKKVSPTFAAGLLFNKSITKSSNRRPYNSGSFITNTGFRFKIKNGGAVEIAANYCWEVLSFEYFELDTNYFGIMVGYILPPKKRK